MAEYHYRQWPSEEFERECPDFMKRAVSPLTPEEFYALAVWSEDADRAEASVSEYCSLDEKKRLWDNTYAQLTEAILYGAQKEGEYTNGRSNDNRA